MRQGLKGSGAGIEAEPADECHESAEAQDDCEGDGKRWGTSQPEERGSQKQGGENSESQGMSGAVVDTGANPEGQGQQDQAADGEGNEGEQGNAHEAQTSTGLKRGQAQVRDGSRWTGNVFPSQGAMG